MRKIEERLNKYPKINKYFKDIILIRSKLKRPDRSDLVKLMANRSIRMDILEKELTLLEKRIKNLNAVFQVDHELNNKISDVDGKIEDLFSEMEAAKFLIKNKFKQIEKNSTPDFTCSKNNLLYAVEVKYIRTTNTLLDIQQMDLNFINKLNLRLRNKKLKNQLNYMQQFDRSLLIVITRKDITKNHYLKNRVDNILDVNYKNLQRLFPNLENIIFISPGRVISSYKSLAISSF